MGCYGSKICTRCRKRFDWMATNRATIDLDEIELVCPSCGTVHAVPSSYEVEKVFKAT